MPESKNNAERLAEAMEQLSEDINGLMEVAEQGTLLQELVDEVRTLRSAIDDVRAEIELAARNLAQRDAWLPPSNPVTSMPLDPCDPNFAARLNAVSRHDLPPEGEESAVDDDVRYESDDEEHDLTDDEMADEELEEVDSPNDDDPPEPPQERPCPKVTAESAGDGAEPRMVRRPPSATAPKGQPLLVRLFQRRMTDLVRLVGHGMHRRDEFLLRVQPLQEKYGEQQVRADLVELVNLIRRDDEMFVTLKPEVLRLAVQIIGRPPAPASDVAQQGR